MSETEPRSIVEGQAITVDEQNYLVVYPAHYLYNSWVISGMRLPAIYVYLIDEQGKKVPIHVTKIHEVLDLKNERNNGN